MSKTIHEICKIPLREPQRHILQNLDDSKFHIIKAPTGVGKSFVAAHIAQQYNGALILCPDRGLQNQYIQEMDISNLWGRAHYHCHHYDTSCDYCNDLLTNDIDQKKENVKKEHDAICEYTIAKNDFKESHYGVTGVELCYYGIKNEADCLIIDEAHNLIDKLTNLTSNKISSRSVLFGGAFATLNFQLNEGKITFHDYLNECYDIAKDLVDDSLKDRRDKKEKFIGRLEFLVNNPFNSGYELVEEKNGDISVELKRLSFDHAFKHLIGDFKHIFLMSATLPDVELFCKLLGIDQSETNVVKVGSPFSPDNVKVFCYTQLDLSSKFYQKNVDAAVSLLDEVLDKEPARGVIHCTSFRQINDIQFKVSRRHKHRLILDTEGLPKSELIKKMRARPDSVLVSASAFQGLDLKGDLGSFTITFKAPFPLWSPWMKSMNNRYQSYYHSQALSRFIQGLGRCLRNETDKASIYLIDRCCGRFIKSQELPDNIRNAKRTLMDLKAA